MGQGFSGYFLRSARNGTRRTGEAGVWAAEGPGHGANCQRAEFRVYETGGRAATVGLIVEFRAVLRRWAGFTKE